MNIIEKYLDKPYWVIDILPKQVPAGGKGQYFKIEEYWQQPPQAALICQKFSNTLIKLNCYYDISVHMAGDWVENPTPQQMNEYLSSGKAVSVVLTSENAMITFNGDDHYMTLYNPNEELLELTASLARSEGLFVWKPPC